MPTKAKDDTLLGTLGNLYGFDYVDSSDSRLSPEQAADLRKTEAQAAFSNGQSRFAKGDYAGAAQGFDEAYRAKPEPQFLYNAGAAYHMQAKAGDAGAAKQAAAYYRRYLEANPEASDRDKVERQIAAMDAKSSNPAVKAAKKVGKGKPSSAAAAAGDVPVTSTAQASTATPPPASVAPPATPPAPASPTQAAPPAVASAPPASQHTIVAQAIPGAPIPAQQQAQGGYNPATQIQFAQPGNQPVGPAPASRPVAPQGGQVAAPSEFAAPASTPANGAPPAGQPQEAAPAAQASQAVSAAASPARGGPPPLDSDLSGGPVQGTAVAPSPATPPPGGTPAVAATPGASPDQQATSTPAAAGQPGFNPNQPLLNANDAALIPGQARNSAQGFAQQAGQVYAVGDAQYNAVRAQQEGQNKVQDAQIAAAEEQDRLLQGALDQRQRDRAAAENSANIQIRAKQQIADDLANQEPDPSRLWNNMATWQKVSLGLGMLANAFANSRDLNHVNSVTQMLMGMVKDDVAEQKDVIAKKQKRAAEGIAEAKEERQRAIDRVDDDYTQQLTRLASMGRVAEAKAASAGRGSVLESAYHQVRSTVLQGMQQLTQAHTQSLVKREEQARAAAAARQLQQEAAKVEMAKAQINATVELEKQRAEVEKERLKNQGEATKDLRHVPEGLGISLVSGRDADGNPITVDPKEAMLHKDYIIDATKTAANANQLNADLTEIRALLANESNWEGIFKQSGAINSKLIILARRIATNPAWNEGGRTAKDDVDNAISMLAGLPSEGNPLSQVTSLRQRMTMMRDAIDNYHKALPDVINREIGKYPLPNGGRMYWTPQAVKKAPEDDTYTLPGEKERRASQAVDINAGIKPDASVTSRLPMSESQVVSAKALEQQTRGMTPERAQKVVGATFDQQGKKEADAIKAEADAKIARLDKNAPGYNDKVKEIVTGMESARAIVAKRTHDAKLRYATKNEASIDEARKKQTEVVKELAGLTNKGGGPFAMAKANTGRDIAEPDTDSVVRLLVRNGFDRALITPEDIANLKKRAVEMAKNPPRQ